jgi:hypothetical protein
MRLFRRRRRALGRIDDRYPLRRDRVRLEVQEGVCLDVFWKSLDRGRGPAAALFVHGDEVLRFDCFGPERGHYHAVDGSRRGANRRRVYFEEATVEDQIERSLSELRQNLAGYLGRNPRRSIRRLTVDSEALALACDQARARMHELLRTVPELRAG